MDDAPVVSIIVRSMARPSLQAALASLAAQTHPAIDVLVVAACGPSHPALPDRAGPHALRLVRSEAPLSRAAAANAGLDAALGEWIGFLDDDDRVDPSHVAGLLDAATRAGAPVITSLARMRLADGSLRNWGQPYATMELFERNFLHLSTVLFAHDLLDAGPRFDPGFDIMEDWDFFLQLAGHARFASCGLRSFEWNADAGDSGAGGAGNNDPLRFAVTRDRIHAKWQPARDALAARLDPLLVRAGEALAAHDLARAETLCREVLGLAVNEPHALTMLAMIADMHGRRDEALSLATLAASVRPHEPSFLHNLARLVAASGDVPRARRLAEHALRLAPDFAQAHSLLDALPKA